MSIEAMKQALEALEKMVTPRNFQTHQFCQKAYDDLRQAIEQAEKQEPLRLWLWKNFVDGKPEYWAFNNPFPCISVEGDPLTLGEPCGWAFLKPSVNGRPHRSEQEVINTVTRLATTPQPQREWVGLTQEDIDIAFDDTQEGGGFNEFARAIEQTLRRKNT